MAHSTPPYRADQVGSLLRSQALTEARAKREKSQLSASSFRKSKIRKSSA